MQSHDYIAMERLFEIHASGEYDLIVVDTPPTRNAVDFLDAPARMSEFFGGRLLRWLTLPYRVGGKRSVRMINFASRPFYQLADRVLGSKFLEDIAEFFLNFQSMYDGFVERARSRSSGCCTTGARRSRSSPRSRPRRCTRPRTSARCSRDREFHLGALVLNKTLPDSLLDPDGAAAGARASPTRRGRLADALAGLPDAALADPARTARVLRTIGESYGNFSVVAMREAELRAELARVPDVVVRVPALRARHQRRRVVARDLRRALTVDS